MSETKLDVLSVTSDGIGPSVFSSREIVLSGTPERMLSEQQSALNFRLRTSDKRYASDWHTAGDPTLLVILQGRIELALRDGSVAELGKGEMFVAEDYVVDGVKFCERHGHKARVIGDQDLLALHLKLAKR